MSSISPAPTSMAPSTPTKDSATGWQRGMSSEVRLAAWIPAIRATPMTSPLGDLGRGLGRDADGRPRPGAPLGGGLVGHVDHARLAGAIEVSKPALAHG